MQQIHLFIVNTCINLTLTFPVKAVEDPLSAMKMLGSLMNLILNCISDTYFQDPIYELLILLQQNNWRNVDGANSLHIYHVLQGYFFS